VHAANAYLASIGKLSIGSVLDPMERGALELRLNEDAKDYYQSALVSFVDGLRSIPLGFFSWATVKFYYSVFYALRSRLALGGECVFYEGKSPRTISIVPGSVASGLKGTTHKCVLGRFSVAYPFDSFLSQEISAIKPLDWFVNHREEVNYIQSRFSEPISPDYLSYAARTGARQMLSSYLSDDVYIHDPDHAMVAFPFRLLIDLRSRLLNRGLKPLVQSEVNFLATNTRDRNGAITAVASLMA
jgi:hypothetical protein